MNVLHVLSLLHFICIMSICYWASVFSFFPRLALVMFNSHCWLRQPCIFPDSHVSGKRCNRKVLCGFSAAQNLTPCLHRHPDKLLPQQQGRHCLSTHRCCQLYSMCSERGGLIYDHGCAQKGLELCTCHFLNINYYLKTDVDDSVCQGI